MRYRLAALTEEDLNEIWIYVAEVASFSVTSAWPEAPRERCVLTGLAFSVTRRPPVSGHASGNRASRDSFEARLLDGPAVDDARAECAIGHTAQRVAHVLQHVCILLGFREFL